MLQMKIIRLKFSNIYVEYKTRYVRVHFHKHMMLIQGTPTKWSLIKYFAFLYDLLGLLNPYIVKLKILFQKVCQVGIS